MRNTFLTFEASPLLIDLDAEDCRAVRAHDAETDGIPHKSMKPRQFELKDLKKRFNDFNKQSRREESRFADVCSNVYSPWRVSDVDVLSAVLLGSRDNTTARQLRPPTKNEGPHRRALWHVLARNGVQFDVRDRVPSITQYLLRRQRLAWRTSPSRGDSGGFRAAIESTKDVLELDRITSNAMQTAEGRALVSAASPTLAKQCLGFATRSRGIKWNAHLERLEQLLCLINNININFRHHKLAPPDSLQKLAVKLATKCKVRLAPVPEEPRLSSPWKRAWAQSSRQTHQVADAQPGDRESQEVDRSVTKPRRESLPAVVKRVAMMG